MEDYSLTKLEIDKQLLSFYRDFGRNNLINKNNDKGILNESYLAPISAKNNLNGGNIIGSLKGSLSSALEKYYKKQ